MKQKSVKRGIYKIINKVNKNFYIGSSINILKRWWEHKKQLRLKTHSNIHLLSAWNKYGKDSFEFIIEKEMNNASEKEILQTEQEYIDLYWDGGKVCYNIAKIADRPDSERKKIPIIQFDKKGNKIKVWNGASDVEQELGISAGTIYNALKGRLITSGGFMWRYANESTADLYTPKEGHHGGHNKRKISKIDPTTKEIIEIYNSIEEAAQRNGLNFYNNITAVASGRSKHANGMVFRYLDKEMENKFNSIDNKSIDNKTCEICKISFDNSRKFASHLQFFHKIKTEEYTIRYLLDGIKPVCLYDGCGEPTRYVSFEFKKYCKTHGTEAMKEGGKIGGKMSGTNTDFAISGSRSGLTEILSWNGKPLNKHYVSSLSLEEREVLAGDLFKWFRANGFPYPKYPEVELKEDFDKLIERNLTLSADNFLNNKDTTGSKLFWNFQAKNFYSTRDKMKLSMSEAFADDSILLKVIRNRVQITFNEAFNITPAMLRQGFRSSASSAATSVFNSLVAKYVWNLAPKDGIVYDYSMGFGHRMLGAVSLVDKNLTYVGVDPWVEVVEANKKMAEFIKKPVNLFVAGAETFCPVELQGKISVAFSSPPYGMKEIYDSGKQMVSTMTDEDFVNIWWSQVVQNIKKLLTPDGFLVLNMYDKLLKPMNQVILNAGFTQIDTYKLLMSRSHFTKNIAKEKHEPIAVYVLNKVD